MSNKKGISAVLIVIGILFIAVFGIGMWYIQSNGLTPEKFDVLSKDYWSYYSPNFATDPLGNACARYRNPALFVGVVSFVAGLIVRSSKSTSAKNAYVAAKTDIETYQSPQTNSVAQGAGIYQSNVQNGINTYQQTMPGSVPANSSSATTAPTLTNVWIHQGNSMLYIGPDGKPVTNTWAYSTGGIAYYMGSDGRMVTNSWVEHEGKWFFVDQSGQQVRNQWIEWNGSMYYLDETGVCTAAKEKQ